MRTAFSNKIILFVLLAISIMSTSCNNSDDKISVKINLKKSLSKYHNAYVDVQNDDKDGMKDRKRGTDVTFLGLEISKALKLAGVNPNISINTAELGVNCAFNYGWGPPRLIRHFNLKFRYVTKLRIWLVDMASKEIIGEVEYERPFFEELPEELIQELFNRLISSG